MRSPARLDAPTGNAARVTPPAQDDGRRSPNDVDESDPEQRALLDAENDMLAADLGSFASASVDDLAEDQEADIFLQVKDAIDTFLLYDFFVICVILLWLVVGVTYRVTVGGGSRCVARWRVPTPHPYCPPTKHIPACPARGLARCLAWRLVWAA